MSNNPYKRTSKVDVIGDLPGADQARNLLRIGHVAQDVTLETKLFQAVDTNGDPSVRVEPTSGSFDVEQADPVALEGDDGTGTYGEVYRRGNALRASLEADEVGLATESSLTSEQAREVATWSAGTLDVEQQTPVGVEDSSGGQVDPATEGTLASRLLRELEADDGSGAYAPIHRNGNALQATIQQWNAGTLLVQEDTPLDVSASTVSIQEDTALDVSGATVPVEQQTPVGVEDSSGGQVDPATEGTLASRLLRELEADDGTGTYGEVYRRGNALRASLEADEVGLATESSLTSEQAREVATWSAGTLDVEQQTPVAVEDTAGNQIDPSIKPEYINYQNAGHDLVGSGDLTGSDFPVDRGTAVIIAATSTDDNAFSVSVEWGDTHGNTYQSESAADIGMDSITEDYARLVRKAQQISITVTDESGAAQNLVNVHVDTER